MRVLDKDTRKQLLIGRAVQHALVIRDDPTFIGHTFIHYNTWLKYTSCDTCCSQRADEYVVDCETGHHANALCEGCYVECKRIQELMITPAIMSYRIRSLAPQFVDHWECGCLCILCSDNEGTYAQGLYFICKQCKMKGTKMLCVDVLLALLALTFTPTISIVSDIRFKIAMLVWDLSINTAPLGIKLVNQ